MFTKWLLLAIGLSVVSVTQAAEGGAHLVAATVRQEVDEKVHATVQTPVGTTAGSVHSDSGATLFNGSNMVYLGLGQDVRFALQTADDSNIPDTQRDTLAPQGAD